MIFIAIVTAARKINTVTYILKPMTSVLVYSNIIKAVYAQIGIPTFRFLLLFTAAS